MNRTKQCKKNINGLHFMYFIDIKEIKINSIFKKTYEERLDVYPENVLFININKRKCMHIFYLKLVYPLKPSPNLLRKIKPGASAC